MITFLKIKNIIYTLLYKIFLIILMQIQYSDSIRLELIQVKIKMTMHKSQCLKSKTRTIHRLK